MIADLPTLFLSAGVLAGILSPEWILREITEVRSGFPGYLPNKFLTHVHLNRPTQQVLVFLKEVLKYHLCLTTKQAYGTYFSII